MKTLQKIFDQVKTHLLSQNERSDAPNENEGLMQCRYRVEREGKILKCAIGCLIPDELYHEELEGRNVSDEKLQEVLSKSGIDQNLFDSLFLFQVIHDNYLPQFWDEELRIFAKNQNLVYE